MRHAIALAGFALCLSACSHAALKAGDKAPDFSAPAALAGKPFAFSLADALRAGPVVVYFYPKAFTSGCSEEAHDFARAMPDFEASEASVIGVSGDGIDTLLRFSATDCAGRFPVAADPQGRIMARYGAVLVPGAGIASRTSYVVAPDGRVLYAYTAMAPAGHVANALAAVEAWRRTHPVPTPAR